MFGLRAGDAALGVRARNDRPNWPCQGTPRTTQCWGPQFLYSNSRLPSMQLNVSVYVCVCACMFGVGPIGRHYCTTCRDSGHAGDLGLVCEPRPERVKDSGSPSSCSPSTLHPSPWALEGFTMNSTRAILFIFLFGYPHLLKCVQRGQDGAPNPRGIQPFLRRRDLDFDIFWGKLLHFTQ